MLDRYWKDVELGVSAHFLFSFSVAAFFRGRSRPALMHVDAERGAVECYLPRRADEKGGGDARRAG